MAKFPLPELRGEDGGWEAGRRKEGDNLLGSGCGGSRDRSAVRLGTGATVSKKVSWKVSTGRPFVCCGGMGVEVGGSADGM